MIDNDLIQRAVRELERHGALSLPPVQHGVLDMNDTTKKDDGGLAIFEACVLTPAGRKIHICEFKNHGAHILRELLICAALDRGWHVVMIYDNDEVIVGRRIKACDLQAEVVR